MPRFFFLAQGVCDGRCADGGEVLALPVFDACPRTLGSAVTS